MCHYTLEEIRNIRRTINDLGFEGREILEKYSDEHLREICNGIGPDWMPELARDVISAMNPALEPVAALHDVAFYEGGSHEQFLEANRCFAANGTLAAKAEYRWYDPRRYQVIWQARKFAVICDRFGWTAWPPQR